MGVDQKQVVGWRLGLLVAPMLALGTGCPGSVETVPAVDGEVLDGNRGPTAGSVISGEPNGSFAQAIEADFDGGGIARLQGTVSDLFDLDVFSLGPVAAGERIVVETATVNSDLDISTALFDSEGRLVSANDDTSVSLDSHTDLAVRHGGNPYYLVATASAFAAPTTQSGTYTIDVTVSAGGGAPAPQPQTLFLDFDGAEVNSPVLGAFTLDPFDAGEIATVYAGQDDLLKQLIVETIAQNFKRFDVAIISSDDGTPDPGVTLSTIYMGGFDPNVFGISEGVDLYNVDFCDDAIIFTASFSPVVFRETPMVAELAVAIGNVAAHEAGHLLGLNHTDDDLDIMDDASPADAFLADQEFMEAPLSPDIMSIGTQDGVLLLSETVGLNGGVTLKEAALAQYERGLSLPNGSRGVNGAFRGAKRVGLHAGTSRQLKSGRRGSSR